jgi:hypothetical protein
MNAAILRLCWNHNNEHGAYSQNTKPGLIASHVRHVAARFVQKRPRLSSSPNIVSLLVFGISLVGGDFPGPVRLLENNWNESLDSFFRGEHNKREREKGVRSRSRNFMTRVSVKRHDFNFVEKGEAVRV